jgi:hypothetical protein
LAAVGIFFAVWHGSYLLHYFGAAEPLGYLSGRESRTAYLTRKLPEYAAFDYINRSTAPSAKIYLLFIGRRAYYCERDYFHDSGDLPGILLSAIRDAKNADQISYPLKQMNVTHLMVREDLLTAFLSNNLRADQAGLWNEFASTRLQPMFRARGYSVYQLNG